ncbi:MAG: Stp1/IreP family PP2C-type Ser/Thr phosphatase [Tissierellia bacterium]|nr:Stp1/IreP family PP2C-type Ser/Thr phosphatase [Tissierellia bacterium]
MEIAVKSDIGRHRDLNEDSFFVEQNNDFTILIVADGMGGHLAGEVASKIATESINEYIKDNFSKIDIKSDLIENALKWANDKIYEKSSSDSSLSNMGTTCDAVLIVDNTAYIGHVGDSRVYLNRENKLRQLTKDHTLINDLIDSGSVSCEEAKYMKQKNIITRALGGESRLNVDKFEIELIGNDKILLCSDGLTNGVSDTDIKEVLEMEISAEEKANMLIYMSNASGGYDNTTVIIGEMR